MNKTQAKKLIKNYFDALGVQSRFLNETDTLVKFEDLASLQVVIPASRVIGKRIEVILRFKNTHLQIMSSYSQGVLQESIISRDKVCSFVNHLNCALEVDIPFGGTLIAKDDDIAYCTHISYNDIEADFDYVIEYILSFQKKYLGDICIPLIFLITARTTLSGAKQYIEKNILNKEEF